ncbi:MAG: hypothetical protein KDA90_21170, partial [Planctomycetaceae bacterium]|nr:hypothetical protein [Planctomycetaceae bacterium]
MHPDDRNRSAQLEAAEWILHRAWGAGRKSPGQHSGLLAAAFGDPHASLLFCEFMRWAYSKHDPLYEVNLSAGQLEMATGLTPKRQREAMKPLIALEIVSQRRAGSRGKNHYRINYQRARHYLDLTEGMSISETAPILALMQNEPGLSFADAYSRVIELSKLRRSKRQGREVQLGQKVATEITGQLSQNVTTEIDTNTPVETKRQFSNGQNGTTEVPKGNFANCRNGTSDVTFRPNSLNGLTTDEFNRSKIDQENGSTPAELPGEQSSPGGPEISDLNSSFGSANPVPSESWYRSIAEAFGSSDAAALEAFDRLLSDIETWSEGDRAVAIV